MQKEINSTPEESGTPYVDRIEAKALELKSFQKENLAGLREKDYEKYLREIYNVSERLAVAEDDRADHVTCEKPLTEAQYIDAMAQCKAFQSILDELPPGVSKAALLYMGNISNWADFLPEKEADFYKEQLLRKTANKHYTPRLSRR